MLALALIFALNFVPGIGIEPIRPQWPQDFKSLLHRWNTNKVKVAYRTFLHKMQQLCTLDVHSKCTPFFNKNHYKS